MKTLFTLFLVVLGSLVYERSYSQVGDPGGDPDCPSYTVSGGGSYCAGSAGVTITLSDSEIGTSYQLMVNGSAFSGSPIAGTGNALTWTNRTTAGTYTVVGTAEFCTATMTGSAVVTVNSLPTLYSVGGGGTICVGTSVSLTTSGSQTGINYQLRRDGVDVGSAIAGTGSPLNWPNQSG